MASYSIDSRSATGVAIMLLLASVLGCSSGNDANASPTATSTSLPGDLDSTARVPIPPTPVIEPTATTTPRPGPVDTPVNGSATSVAVTPTRSPVSGSPAPTIAIPRATETVAPTTAPEPTATPLALRSGEELVNEPLGVLQLSPGFGRAVEYSPGADAANFRVNVGFKNPFHPNFAVWNYGIKFRNDGQTYQMFVFDHEGNVSHVKGNGNQLSIVRTEAVSNMLTGGGASNRITLVVVEGHAFVLVDQLLAAVFDVDPASEEAESAEISVVADIFNQTMVVGAVTEFFDLVIDSAGLVGAAQSGSLVRGDSGQPALGRFSGLTSAGYARVTLISPINAFSGDYSFGLLFRTEAIGIDNWLVLDDSKNWQHVRRSTTGAEVVFSSGRADSLSTGAGNENLLEFLSTGQEHKIYLNGTLLANLNLPPGDLPVMITPFAGFEPEHQPGGLATEYRDFVVWSVAE